GCIVAFLENYPVKNWVLNSCSKEFAENMLGVLHPNFSDISEKVREYFDFYDPLDEVNEKFNVMDMIRGTVKDV
ncbi:MAG: hypothetical protein IJ733_17000, partial [Lachnospiraceae bacterium]|nr:hypothetical protein [Lachnospiraceae bacterium]